jgi:hypothetical protein
MTRIHRRRSLPLAAAILAALACAGGVAFAQDVSYNAMPGTDFTKFTTYKWIVLAGAQHTDQIVDAQIKQAIEAQLAAKNLTKTTDDKADLYVGYQVAINQERQWNAFGAGAGFRFGGMGSATSSTISIGTLDVDIYDQAGKQLVWRSAATKTLDDNPTPQKRQKNIDKAVAKMFKNFPPKDKS